MKLRARVLAGFQNMESGAKTSFWLWLIGGVIGGLAFFGWLYGYEPKQPEWWPGLLLLAPFGMLIISTIFVLWKGLRHPGTRIICFITSSLICIQLFSSPPCRLRNEFRFFAQHPEPDSAAEKFWAFEHQKAVDEIKMRIEAEDTWFRYKFILVGGLFAAFLKYVFGSRQPSGNTVSSSAPAEIPSSTAKELANVRVCWVLALACVIALTIDIHVRLGEMVTNQLGNWIAYHVETHFLETPSQPKPTPTLTPTPTSSDTPRTSDQTPAAAVTGTDKPYPYEQFLRISTENSKGSSGGMHSSELYAFSYWPHLHLLTWILYILYLGTLQVTIFAKPETSNWDLLASYSLVQVTFCAFAWCAHLAPETFEFQIPLFNSWLYGWRPPLMYLSLAALLSLVNLPYALRIEAGTAPKAFVARA